MIDPGPSSPRSSLAPVLQVMGAVCLLIASLAGCSTGPATPRKLPDGVRGAYPFGPTSITIHPLTRYWVGGDGELEVEARIEFQDQDGFATRGLGRLELTLESDDGRIVETWILPLDNLESNRTHFDDVTRTYLVRLSLPNQEIPGEAELQATLVRPNGKRLKAMAEIAAPPDARSEELRSSGNQDAQEQETP